MKTILASLVILFAGVFSFAGDCHVQLQAPLVQQLVVPQQVVVPHVVLQQQVAPVVVPHVQQQVVVPQYVPQQVVVPHVQQLLVPQQQIAVPYVQKLVVPQTVRTFAPFQRSRSVVRQRAVVAPQRVVVRSVNVH